jgi:hypothetical protein
MTDRRPSGVTSSVASVIGNLKRRPARASGVQIKDAAHRIDPRQMRMAGDDDVDAARNGINPQGLEIVHEADRLAGKPHEFRIGVSPGPVAGIHVSADRGDRSYLAKSGNDLGTSDDAAMNDVIHAGQNTFCFRPQQAVAVGDDAASNNLHLS